VGPSAGNSQRFLDLTRITVLRRLVEAEGARVSGSEIWTATKDTPTNTKPYSVLRSLAASNMIQLERSGSKPLASYGQGPRFSTLLGYKGRSATTAAVAAALVTLFDSKPRDLVINADVAETIRASDSSFGQELTMRDLIQWVSRVTNYLSSTRVLSKKEGQAAKTGGYTAWLDEDQDFLASRLMEIYDGLQKPTSAYIDEGHAALSSILEPANHEVVLSLMRKAMAASSRTQNKLSKRATVGSYILDTLNGVNEASLADIYEALLNKNINEPPANKKAVDVALQPLIAAGKITMAREGGRPTSRRMFARAGRAEDIANKKRLAAFWGEPARYAALCRYIGAKMPQRYDAEDVAMNVLATIMDPRTNAPIMSPENNGSAWVYTVASHRAADFYRKRGKQLRSDDAVFLQQRASPETQAAEVTAIEKLGSRETQRMVAIGIEAACYDSALTEFEQRLLKVDLMDPNIPAKEGGEILGISEDSYRVGRYRMRLKLRPYLEHRLRRAAAIGVSIPTQYLSYLEQEQAQDPGKG